MNTKSITGRCAGGQVEFSNHPIHGRAQSIIDTSKKLNKSIIDSYTTRLRLILRDETLDEAFVAKALKCLSEADINNIADWAARKGRNPGRVFVKTCSNLINERKP